MNFKSILDKLCIKNNGDIGIALDNGEYIVLPLSTDPETNRKYLQIGDTIIYHDLVVANMFIPNPNPSKYKRIEHIDGDLGNDDKTNLRWVE